MQQLIGSRWFALAEFIITVVIGSLIFIRPPWGGWLLIILLLPWLIRLLVGKVAIESSALIIPVGLVTATAVLGVWGAYDRQAALEKLWVIIGAVAVFVALANQPRANLGVVASLVGLMGVFIAVFYLLTNDWQTQSSDLELISRTGDWLTTHRPAVDGVGLPANFIGGLLAIIAPIPVALLFNAWRVRNFVQVVLLIVMEFVILLGLFLSSSRGAWFALFAGSTCWLLWRLSVDLAKRLKKSPFLLFGLLLLILILLLAWVIYQFPGGIVALAEQIPGLPSGASRYELAVSTAKLIGDYPFTGGGLRSFPGQFSQYMLVTPFFVFAYSHNFFLDLVFEQGFLGGAAVLFLILGGAWILIRKNEAISGSSLARYLSGAVISSTFVLLLHGLVDDPLYGDLGSPLLLMVPGFAIALAYNPDLGSTMSRSIEEVNQQEKPALRKLTRLLLPGILVVFILAALMIFWKELSAKWDANLGAIQMAKWELVDWPQDRWNSQDDVSPLEPAHQRFDKALSLDSGQRTAWHRSGLISLQARDFTSAQAQLEQAYEIDPQHRGIQKSLGYTYAWNDQLDLAVQMLQGIDEAAEEMDVYAWWWEEQARPDLAALAGNLAQLLDQ